MRKSLFFYSFSFFKSSNNGKAHEGNRAAAPINAICVVAVPCVGQQERRIRRYSKAATKNDIFRHNIGRWPAQGTTTTFCRVVDNGFQQCS